MKKKVFIDCDTGIDDALAFVLACSSNDIEIIGVTTVGGNVSLENTTRNTCNVLNLMGRSDIKVAKGAGKPLKRELMKASGVHGVNGLRGWSFSSNYTDNLVEDKAWDFMASSIMASEEKVIICALAPVTNIALMLEKYPEVKENIDSIVFMGTSWHDGNPSPIATFNVLVDPEAFKTVLFSGVKVVAAPLDTLRNGTIIYRSELDSLLESKSEVGRFVYSIINSCGVANIGKDEIIDSKNEEAIFEERINRAKNEEHSILDPAVLAMVIKPELFTFSHYYCDVECQGTLTTGFTLIDKKNWYGKKEEEKNLWFAETMNRDGFASLFLEAVKKYGGNKDENSHRL